MLPLAERLILKPFICVALAATLLGLAALANAQISDPLRVTALTFQLSDVRATVADWEMKAIWGRWLALAVVVLGGTVTALQPFGSKKWCTYGVAVIGVAISALTFLRNDSDADYKTYRKTAHLAMIEIEQAETLLDLLKQETSIENKETLAVQIANNIDNVKTMNKKIGMEIASNATALITTAHAQPSTRPAWVSQPNTEEATAYHIVGTGADRSLSAAQAQSLQDAQRNAAERLSIPLESAKRYARPIDTYTEYDSARAIYRHYTLIELNKALVRR